MPEIHRKREGNPHYASWQLQFPNDIRLIHCQLRKHGLTGVKWELALISVDIDSAPPYEAVFYVWGDSNGVHDLGVQGYDTCGKVEVTLNITESLYTALPYLLATSATGYLWIDQLCIDQTNLKERNHQVYLMPDIYKRATRVLIWLGPELGELRMLTQLVQTLEKACCEETSTREPIKSSEWNGDCLEARLLIFEILGRPWFTRAWILEEAILPPVATVIMGTFQCDIIHL
jgi:hypothetical protein